MGKNKMKNILAYNHIMDLKKLAMSEHENAVIIKEFMGENGLSKKDFAEKLDIPEKVVDEWLIYNKIDEESYIKMTRNGLSNEQIKNILRNTTKKDLVKSIELTKTILDLNLEEAMKLLRPNILNPKNSINTIKLIGELRNILNRTEMHIERNKNKNSI